MKDYYKIVVNECNISPEYFFDKMDFNELNLTVEGHLQQEDKELDKLRTLGYWFLQPYSKNLKPSDLIKIPSIDNQNNQVNNKVDKSKMLEKAEQIKKQINKKNWKVVKPSELK